MEYTLKSTATLTEEIKKSRFVAFAGHINTEQQAADFIESVQDLSATHNCWAWKIGQQYRFNDDGEPTSTAGRPILSAIEGQNCDHTIVVVVRYYGGIKLGTGGLIRAYGGCASHCLQQAELIPIIRREEFLTECGYSEWGILENELKQHDAEILEQNFTGTGLTLRLSLTEPSVEPLDQFIRNLTKGQFCLERPA